MTKQADFLTEDGAKRLARQIEAYWAERGYAVHIRTEPARNFTVLQKSTFWTIRSDMVNGTPVRRLTKVAA